MNTILVSPAVTQPLKEGVEGRGFLYRCGKGEGHCLAHVFVSLERHVFRKSQVSVLAFPIPALHSIVATGLIDQAPVLEKDSCVAQHPEIQFDSQRENPACQVMQGLLEAFPGQVSVQLLPADDPNLFEAVLQIGEHVIKGSGRLSQDLFLSSLPALAA